MARKQDPATLFVAWCETSPVETVTTVLAIVKGIVARRQPVTRKPRTGKAATTTREEPPNQ